MPLGTLTGSALVVSAPVGQPATLLVDDVRPQSLDLRTGKRVQVVALWYPVLGQQSPASVPELTFPLPAEPRGLEASLVEAVLLATFVAPFIAVFLQNYVFREKASRSHLLPAELSSLLGAGKE